MSKRSKRTQAKAKDVSNKTKPSSLSKTIKKSNKSTPAFFPELNRYFDQYGLYILIFLSGIIAFLVFKDFIFLNKIYLYKDIGSDSINAFYPHEYQVANYMQHENFIPKWSFYQGMGQNIFPFSIPDPYYLILMMFGPHNWAYGIGYMEIAKILSAGIFFYLFLKKLSISSYAAVVGGLLYSFSGFVILGTCWRIFSTEAVYMALLLYSFEKLFQDKKIVLFPIAVCLIAIHQPFDLFLVSLFLIAYLLFRYFDNNTFNFKKLSILFLKVFGLALLGILMSSFFLFPDIIQMLESPRVGGDSSYFARLMSTSLFSFESKMHNVTALMRFFSNDMMGTGSNFHGWYNYLEAPLFYCGLINFLLIPQLFRFLNKKKKLIFSIFISIFLLAVIFPFFRYTFWAFTGDYYRIFSFFIAIFLLLYSMIAFNQLEGNFKISPLVLGISTVVLVFILFHNYFPNEEIIDENVRNKAVFFLIMYAILLFLLNFQKIKNVIRTIILLLILIELVSFSDTTVNDRPVITGAELKQKVGFNDYTIDAINYLKAHDKSFFRVTKDYFSGPAMHGSINDAQVQNFYGTPSYTSFNQINYIKFLQGVDIINGNDEIQTRWAHGLMDIPILHPFGSIKYGLSKTHISYLRNFNYDSLTTIGNVEILKNRVTLPLGFTYNKLISLKDFKKLSKDQKKFTLYKAFVLDDSLYTNFTSFSKFQLTDTSQNYSWDELARDINLLKKDSFQIELFSQNLIKGRINTGEQKLLFFSIPFDKGWKARIDNKEIKSFMANIGFMGIIIDKGEHEIELSFTPRFYYTGAMISIVAIILFTMIVLGKLILERKNKGRPI